MLIPLVYLVTCFYSIIDFDFWGKRTKKVFWGRNCWCTLSMNDGVSLISSQIVGQNEVIPEVVLSELSKLNWFSD